MTKSDLHRLLVGAQDCTDIDEYITEEGGSLPAAYYPTGAVQLLTDLWNVSRDLTFRAIRRFSGLTQRAFAEEYGIPVRTVENWDTGKREPPPYVLELILADILTAREEAYTAVKQRYIDKTYARFFADLRNEDYAEIDAFIQSRGWSKAEFVKAAYEILAKQ